MAKLNSSLSSLSASSYLGNTGNERASSIALSADESSVYVSGYTWSGNFPMLGAYDNSLAGLQDVFVSKLSADLTTLSASTFIGGSDADQANAIVLDSADNVYLTGYTVSTNFPTSSGAYGPTNRGGDDVFVAKLNSSLSSLLGSSYLGSSSNERANATALYNKNLYVGGYTSGADFPSLNYDTIHNGSDDIFLSKLSSNSPPTTTLPTPSQTSSSTITVTTTISDDDGDLTSLTIEHSTDGNTWASSTISDVVEDYGATVFGTGSITGIDTDSTDTDPDYTVNLTITWDIATDLPNTNTSTVYLRIIPNDGTENGTTVTSSAFAIDTADPSVPGDLAINTLTATGVSFTFPNTTSSDTNFSEYKIHYDTSASVSISDTAFTSSTDTNLASSTFGGASTSTAFTGLTPNTLYYFNLFAYDSWGYSTSSATEISTTTLASIPHTLTSSNITVTQATISWNTNNNPAGTEYDIANDPTGLIASSWITDSSYIVSGLSCGTSYGFHVKARNSQQIESGWSDTLSVATASCGAPAPPVVAPPPPPPQPQPEPEPEKCPLGTTDPACIDPKENQPTGLISITNGSSVIQFTNQKTVTLKLDAQYADNIAFKQSDTASSENFEGVSFESISATKSWTLTGADAKKCINARFMNTVKGFSYTTYACVTLDTLKPSTPIINSIHSGVVDGVMKNKPSLSGSTSEPYLKIIITKSTQGKLALAGDTTFYSSSDAQGNWNYSFSTFFDPGTYTISVMAQDQAGNISDTSATELSISDVQKPIEEVPIDEEPKEVVPEEADLDVEQTQENGDVSGDANGDGSGDVSGDGSGEQTKTDSTVSTEEINLAPIEQDLVEIQETEKISATSSVEILAQVRESAVEGVKAVAKQVGVTATYVKETINNPRVESANEQVVAPTVIVATAANAATSFGLGQLLVYIRFLFTQPLMLLRVRKRKQWGVVYNSFTKQPLDLALVRLIDAKTNKIHETQVTDMQGRYIFVSDPGRYRLEITKTGFEGFSVHLKDTMSDTRYDNLYHGEPIELSTQKNVIAVNIPLDPDGIIIPARQLLKTHARKTLQSSLSSVSVFVALISFVISPTLIIAIFLLLHSVIYIIFHYLSTRRVGNNFGTILHKEKNKTLKNTVVRIFDATYNRLIDTKISNTKGRYAALVGSGNYIVTYEKPKFELKKAEVSISNREKLGGVIARDEWLVRK